MARSGLFPDYLRSEKVVESLAVELEGSPNSKVMFDAFHRDPQSIIETVNDKKPDLVEKINVETVKGFFGAVSDLVAAIKAGKPNPVTQVKMAVLDTDQVRSP